MSGQSSVMDRNKAKREVMYVTGTWSFIIPYIMLEDLVMVLVLYRLCASNNYR